MTPPLGTSMSALAIACSKARAMPCLDRVEHQRVPIVSCQQRSSPGLFQRPIALLIPIEPSAVMSLVLISLLSSSDKATQFDIKCSITPLWVERKRLPSCASPAHSTKSKIHLRQALSARILERNWNVKRLGASASD